MMEMYIPMGVPPSVDDLGDAVLILASDLSSTVTGTTLHVDGGTWASSGFLHWPGVDRMVARSTPSVIRGHARERMKSRELRTCRVLVTVEGSPLLIQMTRRDGLNHLSDCAAE